MKKLTALVASLVLGAYLFSGCGSAQVKTYQTLATVETTASAAYTNYIALVAKGTLPTNNVPAAAKAYGDLQQAVITAAIADEAGTNALAPANLSAELTSFLNLVAYVLPTK